MEEQEIDYDKLVLKWESYFSRIRRILRMKFTYYGLLRDLILDLQSRLQFAAHAEGLFPGLLKWSYLRIKSLLSDVVLKSHEEAYKRILENAYLVHDYQTPYEFWKKFGISYLHMGVIWPQLQEKHWDSDGDTWVVEMPAIPIEDRVL